MIKKFIFITLISILLAGCNKDKLSITTLTNQTVRISAENVLIIAENSTSKDYESFKPIDISRIGHAIVPYKQINKDNASVIRSGTGLLIETTNGKIYQVLVQENTNILNILKDSGFNVIEAFIMK